MSTSAMPDVDRAVAGILARVGHDPLYLTLLADLTTLRHRCRFALEEDGVLAVRYLDLPFAAISFYGHGNSLRAALQSLLAPDEPCYALVGEAQYDQLQEVVALRHVDLEWQMVYRGDPAALASGDAVALSSADWPDMSALAERGGLFAFESSALEKGPYFGVRRAERLAAMAGTHLKLDWLAEIGNVVTDPGYRRQGFAMMAVGATVKALLGEGLMVLLQVFKSNAGAVALYQKLGLERLHTMYLVEFVARC